MEAVSNHLGDSCHRLGGGIFDPARHGSLSPSRGLYPQCKSIIMSLRITLEQRWKGQAALDLLAPRSWKPQGQAVVFPGF